MKKVFEVHQKITFLVNEYAVLKDSKTGQPQVVGFAKQKRLALREQFTLFKDEAQSEVLATSKARSMIDLSPTFDVFGSDNKPLAVLKKEFKKSLLVSTWSVYKPGSQNTLFSVAEKNTTVAVFRRLWEFIPVVSEFIPFPIKFHFSIKAGDKNVGEYRKTTTIRDHYALYLEDSAAMQLDERAWMVFAVLLDAMQSR